MIRAEYFRFLQTLSNPSASDMVRKVANLVATHLDELIPLSTYQGQRIRKIVALAQAQWELIRPEVRHIPENAEAQVMKITRLTSMSVGPFRGFARQEVFDLASRLVLIYGPNGTGKSSFCEALEYGLLGSVLEAESKRFRDQGEYLKHARINKFSPPSINAEDGHGKEFAVTPNEAVYRFCFVEKNRIDSFSRIAAQSPAKQTELISTLFGLESFTDFVRNFTAEVDGRYIDLVGSKASILAQRRQVIVGAEQQVKVNTTELHGIEVEGQKLANHYREGAHFSQLVLELNGVGDAPGLIARLETELQRPMSMKSNLTSAALDEVSNGIAGAIAGLVGKQQELAAASQQVSFKNLYEAVSQVRQSCPNECPACRTPLNRATVDPYAHAGQELQKLQQLATIQQVAQQLEQDAKQALLKLSQIIHTCLRYYPQSNPLALYEVVNYDQLGIWWESFHHKLPDGFSPWQHLAAQVGHLEAADKSIDQVMHLRGSQQAELHRLREYSRNIMVLQARRDTANTAIKAAQEIINRFEVENASLIADVEGEMLVVRKNQEITSAYADFVRLLNNYCNSLPSRLVADLGETVVTLYNAFNRNDSHAELLEKVKLPLVQNNRLEIAFKNEPNKLYDALHILSEGHIRCLGLAILLAKNLKEKAPLLIFDDPVNAIDDDHRESIRRTLFEDQYFSDKQIILTCHGEEFFKDIHNLLPARVAGQAKSFSFMPRMGESHIRVDFNCAPRNYILAARGHIDRNEVREALAKSRQALEALAKGKLWRYVNKYGDGNLSLKFRSPSAPIELRNLADQLKSKIEKEDFSDPNKTVIFFPIKALVGLSGDSREWRYLNKGTHEESDRAEFDRSTVEAIVAHLEQLDATLG